SPYADQARLLAARVYVDSGELERAAGELANVAERSKDRDLALVARLRLARVQIAQGKPDGALATLGVVEPGAFAARFHEVRGDAGGAARRRGLLQGQEHRSAGEADPAHPEAAGAAHLERRRRRQESRGAAARARAVGRGQSLVRGRSPRRPRGLRSRLGPRAV